MRNITLLGSTTKKRYSLVIGHVEAASCCIVMPGERCVYAWLRSNKDGKGAILLFGCLVCWMLAGLDNKLLDRSVRPARYEYFDLCQRALRLRFFLSNCRLPGIPRASAHLSLRCTNLQGVQYVGEIMYQMLFEEEGSYHALVVGR